MNNPYDKNISYLTIIQTLSKFENINNIKTLVEKNRLQIFSNFTSFNNNKSKLFSDIKFLVEEDSDLYKKTQFE